MDGTVSSFLPGKGYGFVKGDDSRDYFVHRSDVHGEGDLFEGLRLSFEETSTPKGYRARKVRVLGQGSAACYRLPDDVLTSKSDNVAGWEVIQTAPWMISGESRGSPDDAWKVLRSRARLIGANAVVQTRYFKTRGSESGTGRGTHYFTIHNVQGVPVCVGRRSTEGTVEPGDLPSIDAQASKHKAELDAATRAAMVRARVWGLLVGTLGPVLSMFNGLAVIFSLVLAVMVYASMARQYGGWLQRSGA